MKVCFSRIAITGAGVVGILLSGCAQQPGGEEAIASPRLKQGRVTGGQQPVSGAMLQLYAVGTGGDGSAATPLLTPAAVTDANGNFTITGRTRARVEIRWYIS